MPITAWQPFNDLPDEYKKSRKRFLVRALIDGYTTDEYVVRYVDWTDSKVCLRWPWSETPTHWCPIPE